LRTELTADASFAAIFARKRFGMAIAAMIRMGINDKPRYPNTSPAMAIPRPPRRPALFRISERDKWPMTTATIAAGRKKKSRPETRLPMALPLVSLWPGSA
jgi:hypothetical protein